MSDEKIYLVLQNGKVFEGKSFGAKGSTAGEIVFTTGMTGYLETLTDPNYFSQIVVQTFPMIGNYGVISEDREGDNVSLRAYVVRYKCENPSNFRCEENIDSFMKRNFVIGIYDVDTREITKNIRDNGTMNAYITEDLSEIPNLKNRKIKDLPKGICESKIEYKSDNPKCSIAILDNGTKKSIIDSLLAQSVNVIMFPQNTKAEEILSGNFDGVVISDGVGNPADFSNEIAQIELLMGKVRIFGVGLGHQLMARAVGCKTTKLKSGHRGANQPVKNISLDRVVATNQNHGYVVECDNLPEVAVVSHVNVNDNTIEGIEYKGLNAASIQFNPQIFDGSKDSNLLCRFFNIM